jgi:hypothetical protein
MTRRSTQPNATGLSPAEAGERADLEALRDSLVERLHRRADDFDATRELRLVNSKLQRTSYGKQTVTESS